MGENTMTINEIAELAGVSRATVSRYLNQGYISAEKKEAVRKVIEETGFVPSSNAQTLRTKKTKLIGVILPKINSDSISRMVAGITSVLGTQGYQVLLANTDNNEKKEVEFLQLFQEHRVDGVILIATIFSKEHKKALKDLKVPVVIMGQYLSGYSCVYHDDMGAAEAVTDLMVKAGGKVFGFLGTTNRDEAVGQGRKKGFLLSLKKAKISVSAEDMKEAAFSSESGYEMTRELLEQNPKIDSLFCATDNIAIGAIECLREMKKRIPEDIQVIGFGDSKVARVITPRLTTVHLAYMTSGEEAARMILDVLGQKETAKREIKMGYQLVEGESLR